MSSIDRYLVKAIDAYPYNLEEATDIILFLFTLLNFMVVWMVYSVLRFEYVSPYTFQERFYEDADNKGIRDGYE